MSLWMALLLASAQPAEAPADCQYAAPPPDRVAVHRARPHFCFAFAWPVFPAPMPALETLLREEAARREAEGLRRLEQSLAELPPDSDLSAMPPHGYDQFWSMTANTPVLLAMDAGISAYGGGAHDALSYETLLWDRAAGRRIAFGDLFEDGNAAYALLRRQFCPALLAMQQERGHTAADALPCPDLAAQPIALVSESGPIRTITVLLAPYVAGSFAEGPYEVVLPVTRDLLSLIKPRYRAAFVQ